MSLDSSIIGTRTPEFHTVAERGRLAFFAEATGQQDPVYRDVEAARAAGHPDLPIPPTFLFCLQMDDRSKPGFLEQLGVDMRTILHGEQRFEYHAPAYAGEQLSFVSEIRDVYAKKGGALRFLVRDTVVTRDGEPIATLTNTIVVRDPKAAR